MFKLKSALAKAGTNAEKFNGHSFRIGAVTKAVEKDSIIQTLHGRWKCTAYLLYVRLPREKLAQILAQLIL